MEIIHLESTWGKERVGNDPSFEPLQMALQLQPNKWMTLKTDGSVILLTAGLPDHGVAVEMVTPPPQVRLSG